jgi:hypothetical protein
MKRFPVIAVLLFIFTAAAIAQSPQPTFHDELLDHLQGKWVMSGIIMGQPNTHDIDAQWVLNHQYLCFKETSREKNAQGQPDYDAAVYFGYDQATSRNLAIWLDTWGGFGKATVGYATRKEDELHFHFRDDKGGDFHSVFTYDRKSDTWKVNMDSEENGKLKPFARVTLTRK